MSEKRPYVPGVVRITPKPISEEESKKRIQEIHDREFSQDQMSEGSRHGNRSFSMYPDASPS